jgi:anthranilate phosphoribosyltransferase
MNELIAKIGRGPKTSKDLTWDEAKQAMRLLIEEKASPAQTGAFLIAMRMKGESVTELAAFTSAAREYVSPLRIRIERPLVDVATYAGKQDTFHALIASGITAAAAGTAILMHGYHGIAGRLAAAPVLAALGIPIDLKPESVAREVAAKGFGYLDIALYHPRLAGLLQLRQEFGLRTFVHPVAKMLNPARAAVQIIGVTHPPYFEKTAEALNMLGSGRAFVLRGVEGDPELSNSAATRLLDLRDQRVLPLLLQPKDVGMQLWTFREMAGFAPGRIDQEATLLRRILRNEIRGGPRDWVIQNAAMLLHGAGVAPSISAGVPLAQRSIESGAAARKLQELTAAGQGVAAAS